MPGSPFPWKAAGLQWCVSFWRPKEVWMAFVSKKDLVEKVRPLAEQLARLQDELESLLDQLGDLADDLEDALDEAED